MRVTKPQARRCKLREQRPNRSLQMGSLLNNNHLKWITLLNSTQWWSIKLIRSRVPWKMVTWTANPLNRVIECLSRADEAARFLPRLAKKCSCGRSSSRSRTTQTMTWWVITGEVPTQTHREAIPSKWCLMYPIKVQKLLKGARKTGSHLMKDLYRQIGRLCRSILLQGSVRCIAHLRSPISMGWNLNLEVQVKEWMILLGMKATLEATITSTILMVNKMDIQMRQYP